MRAQVALGHTPVVAAVYASSASVPVSLPKVSVCAVECSIPASFPWAKCGPCGPPAAQKQREISGCEMIPTGLDPVNAPSPTRLAMRQSHMPFRSNASAGSNRSPSLRGFQDEAPLPGAAGLRGPRGSLARDWEIARSSLGATDRRSSPLCNWLRSKRRSCFIPRQAVGAGSRECSNA
jgi:hypothetical protein